MKYTKLGNTDIEVSRICTGCMSFGKASPEFHQWTLNEEDTQKMIAHVYDLGVNFFDTANQYSFGTSEEYIGKAFKNLGIPRDKVVIATKVYFNEGHLKKEAILREIDGSLERLGTDYVDLYIIHRFDAETPIEETMETLNFLVQAGKVRALGASAMYEYQFHDMQQCAKEHGWAPFVSMQNHWNLLYREDEREMIPYCKETNVSLTPYSPLAGGHLARPTWDSDSLRSKTDKVLKNKYDKEKDNDLEIIARVHELSECYNVSMTVIALSWLLARGAAAPIVGATKAKHFDEAVKAVDFNLSDTDLAYLEEAYRPHELVGLIKHL